MRHYWYAADAVEAEEIAERVAAAGMDMSPDQVRREWRGRLLHRIAEDLPMAWLRRHGPLPKIEDDRIPEVIAGWGGDESPIEASALADLPVDEALALLATWSEPGQPRLGVAPWLA